MSACSFAPPLAVVAGEGVAESHRWLRLPNYLRRSLALLLAPLLEPLLELPALEPADSSSGMDAPSLQELTSLLEPFLPGLSWPAYLMALSLPASLLGPSLLASWQHSLLASLPALLPVFWATS